MCVRGSFRHQGSLVPSVVWFIYDKKYWVETVPSSSVWKKTNNNWKTRQGKTHVNKENWSLLWEQLLKFNLRFSEYQTEREHFSNQFENADMMTCCNQTILLTVTLQNFCGSFSIHCLWFLPFTLPLWHCLTVHSSHRQFSWTVDLISRCDPSLIKLNCFMVLETENTVFLLNSARISLTLDSNIMNFIFK